MTNLPVSIFCPFCKRHTSLAPAPILLTEENCGMNFREPRAIKAAWTKSPDETWWIGICNYCHSAVLVRNNASRIYPNPMPSPTDERIPELIRQDLDEAKMCFSVNCFRACAVMSRRAMQSTCIDKGVTKGDLVNQLQELASKMIITQDVKEWADTVRWTGNDAAHPGGESVDKKDAEDILNLAEQFLHIIYVTPAIAKEQRAKRDK